MDGHLAPTEPPPRRRRRAAGRARASSRSSAADDGRAGPHAAPGRRADAAAQGPAQQADRTRELNVSVETVKDHVAAVLRARAGRELAAPQAMLAVGQMTQGRGFLAAKAGFPGVTAPVTPPAADAGGRGPALPSFVGQRVDQMPPTRRRQPR